MQAEKRWRGTGPILLGVFSIIALLGVLGVWGTQTQISGAVLAPGQLFVESKRQVVQHREGGTVKAVLVQNGDEVAENQVLVQFDGAEILSEVDLLRNQIAAYEARAIRLRAERDDVDVMAPLPAAADAALMAAYEAQATLFAARRSNFRTELEQLAEVKAQTAIQAQGVEAQETALGTQIALVSKEVERRAALLKQSLLIESDLTEVQAELADLQGQIGSLTAEAARLKSRVAQIEIERSRLGTQRQEAAIDELATVEEDLRQSLSRLTTAQRRLSELDVTAPVSGVVLDMQVNGPRMVVRGGDPMMYIVPRNQDLIVVARVSEIDIDQIKFNQSVNLRFSALDTRFTPTIAGQVERISADILYDETSRAQYYEVEIRPDTVDLEHLDGQRLVPGMPVEAYIQTGERSPLEYLLKPLADYFYRAFRAD